MKKILLLLLVPFCCSLDSTQAQQLSELGRINLADAGATNVMGVKIGPDGKIYFVDRGTRRVFRIENDSFDASDISSYLTGTNSYTTIADGVADNIVTPVDLDFHPIRPNELWILNQGSTNTGGNTTMITNPGDANQTIDNREDGNAWHFMALATAMAFGDDGNWATSQGILDANRQGGVFTGPTLWPGDLNIYAMVGDPPSQQVNGSHLDMIHQSPYSMGIAHEKDNVYWVFDGFSENIVRYDFVLPHPPGGADHSDGIVRRYVEVEVQRKGTIPAHMVVDKSGGKLLICDTENSRILSMDVNSGEFGTNLTPMSGEPLAEYSSVVNVQWSIVASNVGDPVGIDIQEATNIIIVTDNSTDELIIFDAGTVTGVEQANAQQNFSFKLYPNPTNGFVSVDVINAPKENLTLNVFDVMGKQVMETRINLENNKSIDLSDLPDGVYHVTMRNADVMNTQRVVISH